MVLLKQHLLYKLKYFEEFLNYINKLEKQGLNVIFCGDVNIAHEEIDLARPKNNENEVGFLPEERLTIDEIIEAGFVDVFRVKHPNEISYTWWDMKTFSRDRNVGWRLDYFFVDEDIFGNIKSCLIHNQIMGSDHCPIEMNLK